MKEVLRMFAYSAVGIAMITLLLKVTSSKIPAGMEIMVALVVVVVLPLAIMFAVTRRKKAS